MKTENPDERRDADSDVEMNDAKPLDDSGRYLLLFGHVICSSNCFRWLYCVFYFVHFSIIGGAVYRI